VSKFPSLRCVTGMPRGASSEESTEVKDDSAATMLDSGAWNAGDKLEIIDGVRTSTDGFGGEPACECWCEAFGEARIGRKDCRVRMGVSRRVFSRSLSVEGDKVAIGEEG
jgi:hypothetical protein